MQRKGHTTPFALVEQQSLGDVSGASLSVADVHSDTDPTSQAWGE